MSYLSLFHHSPIFVVVHSLGSVPSYYWEFNLFPVFSILPVATIVSFIGSLAAFPTLLGSIPLWGMKL